MAKKKTDTGYRVAVLGAKGIIKILVYVLILITIIYLSKTAYSFGYAIFNQKPVAEKPGQAVTVIIPEGSSARDIGNTLEKKGLIEDAAIFAAQERLSVYHGKLLAGTYLLNTSQTADEMMEILSGNNTEGQISVNRDEDAGDGTGTLDDAVEKVE